MAGRLAGTQCVRVLDGTPRALAAGTNLGAMYEYGEGVKKDLGEAAKWYRKAADQGNENAKKALANLQPVGRPQQLGEAEGKVEQVGGEISQVEAVRSAEARANLTKCLDGRYPALCNHSLLSSKEQAQVLAAEKRENLRVCMDGRYPALCNRSLLD